MSIDHSAACKALEPIAKHFGMSLEEAADSAIQLANANIVRAIQVISTERGHDPRDSVMVPYGGAGPLHAAQVASDLRITTVVVPPNSGVISAYGLLASDFIQFETLTRRGRLDESAPQVVREAFAEMHERGLARARDMQLGDKLQISFVLEMRFVGQAFEVPVELQVAELPGLSVDRLRELFGAMHQKLFFFGAEDSKPIEFVSFRLGLTAPLETVPVLAEQQGHRLEPRDIDVFDGRAWRKTKLMSRIDMRPGAPVPGPALLDDPTSTLLVPQGWLAERDRNDNIILTQVEK